MRLNVELEQEEDRRWIAEVVDLPGVLAYGDSPDDALRAARALALRVIADRIEHGELDAQADRVGGPPPAIDRRLMARWPATKARRVLKALFSIGLGHQAQRPTVPHKILERPGWPEFRLVPSHAGVEIRPSHACQVAKGSDGCRARRDFSRACRGK